MRLVVSNWEGVFSNQYSACRQAGIQSMRHLEDGEQESLISANDNWRVVISNFKLVISNAPAFADRYQLWIVYFLLTMRLRLSPIDTHYAKCTSFERRGCGFRRSILTMQSVLHLNGEVAAFAAMTSLGGNIEEIPARGPESEVRFEHMLVIQR